MGKQSDARFKFLVRPFRSPHVSSQNLAREFEDEAFSLIKNAEFSSPITGMVVLPIIVDDAISTPPPDSTRFFQEDSSVSAGIQIDFALWERSTELERLGLLADNIRHSLGMIESRYLVDEDREKFRSFQLLSEIALPICAPA